MSLGPRNLLVIVTMAVLVSAGCTAQSATPAAPASPALSSTAPAPVLKYSAVISTYPGNAAMCSQMGDWFKGAMGFNVTCDDLIRFGGAGKAAGSVVATIGGTKIEVSADVFKDYGVKVQVDVPTPVGGTTYPAGAMLTVDANLNWTQVSGWD
jgi:hypothetical protein